jgi:hypothetical protein
MVIAECGTFKYHGTVPVDFATSNEVTLVQSPRPDESLASQPLRYNRLVGFNPTLRFTGDSAVIKASARDHTQCESFRFGLLRHIPGLLEAGDNIFISRTFCAWLGFSIVRNQRLVVGLGAVCSVPLGDVAVHHSPKVRKWTSSDVPERHDDHFLKFTFGGVHARRVHDGETIKAHGYSIYVRNTFLQCIPGDDECALIVLDDHVSDPLNIETVEHFLELSEIEDWPDIEERRLRALREDGNRGDSMRAARETLRQYIKNQNARRY